MSDRRLTWRDVLCVALVALIAIALWQTRIVWPVAPFQSVGQLNGDLYTIYYPLYSFAYRGAELLPAWNPYQLAGTPTVGYLAGGLYYPPNWLSVAVPVHRALGYLLALHLALAGLGTWLLARCGGLSLPGASIAAVAFLANSFLVTEHLRPMYLFGLAWIPMVVLFAGRLIVAPTIVGGLGLGIATALQLLTGHAQMVCYEAYLGLLVGMPASLVLARKHGGAYVRAILRAGAVALGVAILLAAAQIVPTLEVMLHAVRGFGGLTVAQTLPQRPSWLFLRSVLTTPGIAVLLVPAALLAGGRRELLAAVCVVVLLVAGAIGMGTAAYDRAFYHLPGVSLFRLPQQMLAIAALALALLGGIGLDVLASERTGWKLVVALAGLALVGFVLRFELGTVIVVGMSASVLVLAIFGADGRVRGLALAAILVLAVGERFAHTRNTIMIPPTNPDTFFSEPAFVGFLRRHIGFDRVVVIKAWRRRFPIMEKMGSLQRFGVAQDYEPLTPNAYHDFLQPLEKLNPDRPLFWGRYVPPQDGSGWRPLDLLSARYVVVAPTATWKAPEQRFRQLYEAKDAIVYENTEALPRALVVGRHRVVANERAALAAVMAPTFDPRMEVILDREPSVPIPVPGEGERAPGEATIVQQETTRLTVRASSRGPAFVLVNDLYWPGWRATIDGAPTEILRANYLFRAVHIPSGEHEVTFTYASPALRYGKLITIVTILGLLAALAIRAATHRRRNTPQRGSVLSG